MTFMRIITHRLKKHQLLITNTLANGFLLASGDFVVQQLERNHEKKINPNSERPFINWQRTRRFLITGLCFGPVLHGWYTLLDYGIPHVTLRSVALKVFFDQTIACPVSITYFFFATGYMEGKSISGCIKELKEKFLVAYIADWFVWPPGQTINFYFVPARFRVIFVSSLTFLYGIFLSYLKNSDIESMAKWLSYFKKE